MSFTVAECLERAVTWTETRDAYIDQARAIESTVISDGDKRAATKKALRATFYLDLAKQANRRASKWILLAAEIENAEIETAALLARVERK